MPFRWLSAGFQPKIRFSNIVSRFKRKLSAIEMVETCHPSLEEFLDQCSQPPIISPLSIVSFNTMPKGETLPTFMSPTLTRQVSDGKLSVTVSEIIEDQTACQGTETSRPSTLMQPLVLFNASHPAIIDLPPPFNRHSDPTYREGPAKRADFVRQASQRAVLQRSSALNNEAEELAKKLEETEQELHDSTKYIENLIEERVAKDEIIEDLHSRLSDAEHTAALRIRQCHDILIENQDLRQEHGKCYRQIQLLTRCKRHKHCELRQVAINLSNELSEALARCEGFDPLQYQRERLEKEVEGLRESNTRLQCQNAELQERLADLQTRNVQEDNEDLRVAEREVFVMHERLREAEQELKQRSTLLELLRQNNRDLVVEISCLKHRSADTETKSNVRHTV